MTQSTHPIEQNPRSADRKVLPAQSFGVTSNAVVTSNAALMSNAAVAPNPGDVDRRTLIRSGVLLAATPWLGSSLRSRAWASEDSSAGPVGLSPSFPTQDPAVVKEVVGVSHGNLDRLKELVEPRPELANAAWDWGFGDWETALGAASHVGRPAIANYLISKGARPDIFTAAMLGNLAAVKSFIEMSPGIEHRRGPHGIPLLSHAKAGREAAAEVVAYLESLPPTPRLGSPISDEELQKYLGSYRFGTAGESMEVAVSSMGGIGLSRGESTPRRLNFLGNHEFYPAGAESARVRFELRDGVPVALEIWNPKLVLRALRAPTRTP